jgi:hypothetical protein
MPVLRFAKRYTYAAAGALYAFTAGVRHARHRGWIHRAAEHFGYDDHPPRLLPTVAVDELTSPSTVVSLPEPVGVDGNVTLLEMLVLNRLVRERAPRAIFEIGTFDGRTTLNLAVNAGADARVYTLDLPRATPTRLDLSADDRAYVEKDVSGARFAGTPAADRITQLYGDSAAFDFSPYPSDFVFVDGAHTEAYVRSDAKAAAGLLPGGRGTIAFHDYGVWPGVTMALNALRTSDARFAGLRWVAGTTLAVATLVG